MEALGAAISLAEACHATLVALALLRVKGKRSRQGPRLEDVMEANNFLEAVRWKAARAGVSTEGFQVLTAEVGQSLDVLIKQFSCSGIVLLVREGQGILLSTDDIVGCLHLGHCTSYLVQLPAKRRPQLNSLFKRLFSFASGPRRRSGSPSGEPTTSPLASRSQEPGHDETQEEEAIGQAEDVAEDERMQSHD
ncbi:hypothetical protein KSC_104830 [Ktedonobacter sp. SOSP1-52]|uniref:hypothetical protein n=1 Tax=Ktedonobacter sp. SOSP1-52 TaxID=2778366 RepID=UPI001915E6AE|nr:hypothetical protein [Ktedonobacter sp. SOSP1-52]GHO71591.1 hypothetical protein KSC_104830 [Ktedonobacter sp. SOSP1-52]